MVVCMCVYVCVCMCVVLSKPLCVSVASRSLGFLASILAFSAKGYFSVKGCPDVQYESTMYTLLAVLRLLKVYVCVYVLCVMNAWWFLYVVVCTLIILIIRKNFPR